MTERRTQFSTQHSARVDSARLHPGGDPVGERAGERGVALIIAIFFTVFALGLILSGTVAMDAAQKRTNVGFLLGGQARQFAEAGIIDALSWFRRQTTQPVVAFDPKRDTTVTPPILDTDDPAIGIVRSFEISRGVWGRYEVRRSIPNVSPPEPEVEDISAQRGATTAGSVWKIVSRGYVFRLVDDTVKFDESPNQVLAVNVVETEIRRLSLVPPSFAALSVRDGSKCMIANRGRIQGSAAAGIGYDDSTSEPSVLGEVTGSPDLAPVANYNDTTPAIFGVTRNQLRSVADDRVSSNGEFPNPVPTSHLVFVETDVVFDKDRPLRGTGIVFVDGNVTIKPGSNSFFNGFLLVTGNLDVSAPALLRGTVVARNSASFKGVGDH